MSNTLKRDLTEPILVREGGYVDRADDKGGPTNFGVTLTTFRAYMVNDALTAEDLKKLDRETARDILWREFIERPGIDRIQNERLRARVADAAVNHGPRQAIKFLQRALGVSVDGVIGPATLAALPYLDASKLIALLDAERLRFLALIARKDKTDGDGDGVPDQLENLPGWINRMADIIAEPAQGGAA